MNIKIKCMLNYSLCTHKFLVCVYDSKNKLVCKDYTNKYGILDCKLPSEGIYKIIVFSNLGFNNICSTVDVKKGLCRVIPFVFGDNSSYNSHKVTFILTDRNYKDLPIMKGEIILWHNNNHITYQLLPEKEV